MEDTVLSPCHSLSVLSASELDIVRFAGGLICDRARQGWRVVVLLPVAENVRPLRIIGAQVVGDFADFPTCYQPSVMAVAVSATIYHDDVHLRAWLQSMLPAELLIWGSLPVNLRAGTRIVSHRLSDAARVFKAHAFAAAGAHDRIKPIENFRTPRGVIRGNVVVPGRQL